jgi:hypothetical protein
VVGYTTADENGSTTPCCQSLCAVADIFGKPEGLARIKKYLNQETDFNTVLAEKMLQFKLSAPHSVRIPASEAQGSNPIHPPRACCHITERITVFRTARGRAVPVGRKDMDLRIRRVYSTRGWRGRRSRSSEISSSMEAVLWVVTTRLVVVGLAAAVLTHVAAFILDFPASGLVVTADLVSVFLGPAF